MAKVISDVFGLLIYILLEPELRAILEECLILVSDSSELYFIFKQEGED